jgi:hypothetical protein
LLFILGRRSAARPGPRAPHQRHCLASVPSFLRKQEVRWLLQVPRCAPASRPSAPLPAPTYPPNPPTPPMSVMQRLQVTRWRQHQPLIVAPCPPTHVPADMPPDILHSFYSLCGVVLTCPSGESDDLVDAPAPDGSAVPLRALSPELGLTRRAVGVMRALHAASAAASTTESV